ncbi:uncharacterized protein LOC122562284 isoform X1 [Chiloscyllium plagiosum]|uniref:uncharacterized protein LOC122562284 isoform X1 n=1 Tax=Chiloscyllium plagiosum TaxID=36176 RepID=UPI001CB7B635|nr:uncharacterized protein LOC122562284 isoform X1 [Chiloscyllium plagiosum]
MYRKISEFGCSSWDPKLQSLGIFGKNREDAPCRFRRSLVSLLAAAAWVSEIRAGRPWKQDGTRSGNSCAQDPGKRRSYKYYLGDRGRQRGFFFVVSLCHRTRCTEMQRVWSGNSYGLKTWVKVNFGRPGLAAVFAARFCHSTRRTETWWFQSGNSYVHKRSRLAAVFVASLCHGTRCAETWRVWSGNSYGLKTRVKVIFGQLALAAVFAVSPRYEVR